MWVKEEEEEAWDERWDEKWCYALLLSFIVVALHLQSSNSTFIAFHSTPETPAVAGKDEGEEGNKEKLFFFFSD